MPRLPVQHSQKRHKKSLEAGSGCFKDPDGNLWEVAYNPFF